MPAVSGVRITTSIKCTCQLTTFRPQPSSHIWYKMQGCVIHRVINNVDREPSLCRLIPKYNKPHAQVNIVRMVVVGYCSNTNGARHFRCEDNNVAFTHVQPQYYRVRQMEPCHQLEWSSQALILNDWALGAMPKQLPCTYMNIPPCNPHHTHLSCNIFILYLYLFSNGRNGHEGQ